jgi:uncharacterized membrane protein YdjX (TVP38/TMEM64 family)
MMHTQHDRRRLVIAVTLISALLIGLIILYVTGYAGPIIRKLWEVFQGKDQLRAYVESWGYWAPVAFITIQALQVVLAPIPGELTGAVGGFMFGAAANTLYSTIGLTIGSVAAFGAARIIGVPLVKLVVSEETMERFHFLTEKRGTVLAFILFTVPGFPKDILSYILGLSPMSFFSFFVAGTLGRIPGTVMLSLSGSAVFDENWGLLIFLSALSLLFIGIFLLVRRRFENWIADRGKKV